MKVPRRDVAGFSLVEVVMALGLFAFCIVAIVGLLGVGLTSTRSVANESTAISLAQSIYGAWQVQSARDEPLTVAGLFSNLPPLTQASSNSFYFDSSGLQVPVAQGAAVEMIYLVSLEEPVPGASAQRLDLTFRWPAAAGTNAAQTRSFTYVYPQ